MRSVCSSWLCASKLLTMQMNESLWHILDSHLIHSFSLSIWLNSYSVSSWRPRKVSVDDNRPNAGNVSKKWGRKRHHWAPGNPYQTKIQALKHTFRYDADPEDSTNLDARSSCLPFWRSPSYWRECDTLVRRGEEIGTDWPAYSHTLFLVWKDWRVCWAWKVVACGLKRYVCPIWCYST